MILTLNFTNAYWERTALSPLKKIEQPALSLHAEAWKGVLQMTKVASHVSVQAMQLKGDNQLEQDLGEFVA